MCFSGLSFSDAGMNEEKMDGSHLAITCQITCEKPILTHALIDNGATGYAFIDHDFACHHHLQQLPLKKPRRLEVIDGRPVSSGMITHYVKTPLKINNHLEEALFYVTKLGHYPIVLGIPWLRHHDVHIRFPTNTVTFNSPFCVSICNSEHKPVSIQGLDFIPERPPLPQISLLSASAFLELQEKEDLQIFSVTLQELEEVVNGQSKAPVDPVTAVPAHFHDFLHLFREAEARKLPPHRPYDHKIPLKPGTEPPFGPLYGMSHWELQSLKDYIEDNLEKGFIRHSSSPAGAPVLFVKKSDGSLRLCVDYRGLNEITIKNRYPLPLIQETLARLQKAKWYTKLDMRGAYNLLRIAEGEEWKTAFRTRYGHFEYTVMPFGLTNAPASFQHFVNDVLRKFLDRTGTAFLDDVLIYSDTLEENIQHTREILESLSKAGIHLKPEKCRFHVQEVDYLGLVITPGGIKMQPSKVSTIQKWESPKSVKQVQEFLGFANFYRRFILNYSGVVAPLTRLTRKDVPFVWDREEEEAFQNLKNAFTSAPILRHFDWEKPIVVETDASDFVSAGVLSQPDEKDVLHPVAFFSKKHSPAECNYEIYDKELLAIVRCFEEWRPHLVGSPHPIQVLTDHKNLEYFKTKRTLNQRQIRWSAFMSEFPWYAEYRPGKLGGKPDSLTRRSGDLPQEGDERLTQRFQALLKPANLKKPENGTLHACADVLQNDNEAPNDGIPNDDEEHSIDELFKQGFAADPFPARVLGMLRDGVRHTREISLAECREENGRLIYRNRIYVPSHDQLRLRILRSHHDPPAVGHPGRAKTLELIDRAYYWPTLRKDVKRFVRNCHVCRRTKATRHARYGVLKPLAVPDRPWQHISVDFVTGLPQSGDFDAICVFVDRLTKQRHLIPCRTTITAEQLADVFCDRVFRYHGLPDTIISDRGPQFASRFWRHLCACMKIDARLSTAFHPETDGQTERINAIMEQHLRAYVSYLQDDWTKYLFLAEFAGNNLISETTTMSPFFANFGFHPKWNFELDIRVDNRDEIAAQTTAERLNNIHDVARSEMRYAQTRQQDNTDNHRVPAPAFQPGDLVCIDGRFWHTERPSRKLENKHHGPYRVIQAIGTHAYELDLPDTVRKHRVFPVSLLHLAANDPFPGQIHGPPPPVIVNDEEEWEVEEILDSRRIRRKLQYLVKWRGFAEPTWEPEEFLEEAQAVDVFHEKYPGKPAPRGLAGMVAASPELSNERGSYCHSVDPLYGMSNHSGCG